MSFSPIKKVALLFTLPMFIAMWIPLNAASEETRTHIRTLASSCATCHGVQAKDQAVIPSLAGLDADYFIRKMKAYRSSDKEHDVMVQHAKGLTETEIRQLAILFSRQPGICRHCQKHPVRQAVAK